MKKLISMVDFILEIDWLTTKEFCDKYKVPYPVFTGEIQSSVDQFLQIDAIKQKMFVEYAKFLNKKIILEMFTGKKPVFYGFEIGETVSEPKRKILKKTDSTQVFAYLDDGSNFNMHYPRQATKIHELVDYEMLIVGMSSRYEEQMCGVGENIT